MLDAEQALESLSEPNPRHALAERLLAEIPHEAAARTPEEDRWHLQEMFGHVVEFHQREEKPLWWATFERHAMTEQELVEDLDCLGGLERASDPPVRIKNSLGFWYVFDPDQDTKLTAGKICFFAHDLDITTDIPGAGPRCRAGVSQIWAKKNQATRWPATAAEALVDSE